MINIPYDFNGTVKYEDYNSVINRIKKFNNYKIFGKDQSGLYDMYYIQMGNEEKPVIMFMASMHGTEWQGTQYSLSFMEQLRDNTFPDDDFRDYLLNNFNIIYVPVLNPYGYDRVLKGEYGEYTSGNYEARYNANGIELNSDFFTFNEQESRNMKKIIDEYKPFAFLDIHMYQPDYNAAYGRNAIMASGQQSIEGYQDATLPYRNLWKTSMENYLGEEITSWTNILSPTSGLARAYVARSKNPYTEFTLSYICEVVRPAYRNRDGQMKLIRPLTDEEIFKYGFTHIYLFLKTSTMYYEDYKDKNNNDNGIIKEQLYKIELDHKTVFFERDEKGITNKIIEEYKDCCDNMIIETVFLRDGEGKVFNIIREKK